MRPKGTKETSHYHELGHTLDSYATNKDDVTALRPLPTRNNPRGHPERVLKRDNLVL